jgi:hypothetical protein
MFLPLPDEVKKALREKLIPIAVNGVVDFLHLLGVFQHRTPSPQPEA